MGTIIIPTIIMRISSFSLLLLASLASSSSVVGQGLRGGLAKPLMKLDGHAEADQDLTVRRLGGCTDPKNRNSPRCKKARAQNGDADGDADGSTGTDSNPDLAMGTDEVKKPKKDKQREP